MPSVALLLALPAVLLAFVPGLAERCELDRTAVAAGELWRIAACHWTHWSADHLRWDLATFLGLAAACELSPACGRRRLLAVVALATFTIPAAFWLAVPEMARYRGLSGIDSALFVLLAATLLRANLPGRFGCLSALGGTALLLFLLKAGWETATGGALFAAAGTFVPGPLAHLVGGLCGLAVAWWSPLAARATAARAAASEA
jgi:rhomboid family GlyGly-CTERM serine protease